MFLKILVKKHFLLDAHIFLASKQIYNIKPNQKIHQIRSQSVKWREEGREREATGLGLIPMKVGLSKGGNGYKIGNKEGDGDDMGGWV